MIKIPEEIQNFLKEEFSKLPHKVKLLFFTQPFECPHCEYARGLLSEIVKFSEKIILEIYDFQKDSEKVRQYKIDKIPAIVVEGVKDYGIRYFGVPSGYEFNSLTEDIIDVSRGSTDLSEETKNLLKKLTKPVHIQVFISLTCPYCPSAVRMAHKLAIESDFIRSDMIESAEFPHLINKYDVFSVPKVNINEDIRFEGALPEPLFVEKVMEVERK